MISKLVKFITVDIWRIPLKTLPRGRYLLVRQLRIIVLAMRGFDEDKCLLRASSLTFYCLLAIVPVVAMIFGIAQGFGIENLLETQLLVRLQGQEEVVRRIIEFARSLLERTKGGVVAGIGIALLFWTVIRMLSNIENSFNDIWGVKESRSLARKFSDYLAIMLVSPILIIMPGSITIAIAGQLKFITQKISLLGAVGPFIFSAFKLIPFAVIWAFLTFIYIFMPNTKVNIRSALLGGIAAGTVYQLMQFGYINTQMLVSRYGAIYGSFAALPLFLIWLQFSWLIILFGVEVSFAHQNVETYEFEPDCLRASHSFKRLVSLGVTHLLVKNFSAGGSPMTSEKISHVLEAPIRLINEILYELVKSGILSEVKQKNNKTVAYQPAKLPEKFTLKYVIDSLEKRGSHDLPILKTKEMSKIAECLSEFEQTIESSPANLLLKDI